jgi:hypothetical protein
MCWVKKIRNRLSRASAPEASTSAAAVTAPPPIRHTGLRIETSTPPQLPTPPESQERTQPRIHFAYPADELEVKKETQTEQTDDPTESDPEWTQRILNMCIVLRRKELGLPELPRDRPEYKAADKLSHPLEPPPNRKWDCHCGKRAAKILCKGGRLENRGKWFFRCEKQGRGGCDYWEWIETGPEKCLRSHIVAWPRVIRKQNADQAHYMY